MSIKTFLMKKMMAQQLKGVPQAEQDKMLAMIEKNPDLFQNGDIFTACPECENGGPGNPNHTGEEEYNFFLTVLFPSSHLKILDYNRLIKDLNGMTPEEVINKLEHIFLVEEKGSEIYKPEFCHNFSMYMDGKWYSLTAKKTVCNESNPIDCLDTSIFALMIAKDIFGIDDQRKSKRIDFVGGIRGLGELKKRVDSGEMAVAFAFYPVSMEQLFKVADTNNIMPPKVTWFEPKLRSGLVLHNLND